MPDRAVLLSPFDNLLWDRAWTRRLFAFDHLIEVYKPNPERVYGYYVLPLLPEFRRLHLPGDSPNLPFRPPIA